MKVSDSDNLAYVLKHFTNYRHGTVGEESVGGGDTWAGVEFLKGVDHQRVAERLLSRNWHNKKSASAAGLWIPEVEWEYREVAREREVYKHFNMIKKDPE